MTREFPKHSFEELGYYVYRLVDPRNAQTFYVGKGKGNRVFSHVDGAIGSLDTRSQEPKSEVIRDIYSEGLQVVEIIHRFGLEEDVALEVEAALIDAYPGLSNLVAGHGVIRSGTDASHLAKSFDVVPLVSDKRILFISVNRSLGETGDLERSVRIAWSLDMNRAQQAEYVAAVRHGVVVGVFKPSNWREVTSRNFPEYEDEIESWGANSSGYGFDIERVPESGLLNKSMPDGIKLSQMGVRYYNF